MSVLGTVTDLYRLEVSVEILVTLYSLDVYFHIYFIIRSYVFNFTDCF